MPQWRVVHGTVDELHALAPDDVASPELWLLRPADVALVRGTTQSTAQFDLTKLRADGVALASRRSGGGAVFIDPACVLWADVLVPRASAMWREDLVASFVDVGDLWQGALHHAGIAAEMVVESGERTASSSLVCWAGLGWGELVDDGKVVGLSQRRTRWGTRVQGMAVLGASAVRAADYFTDDTLSEFDVNVADLRSQVGSGLPDTTDLRAVERALIELFEARYT